MQAWGFSGSSLYLKWERELIPRLESGRWVTGEPVLDEILAGFQLENVTRVIQGKKAKDPAGLKNVLRLDVSEVNNVADVLSSLRRLPGTLYVEENPLRSTCQWPGKSQPHYLCEVPNDPMYPQQWFYPIMSSPAAWDVARGSGVVVAVVDNGTHWEHPDLLDNVWINPGDPTYNGVDDDGNGFVDDVRGWDFFDYDNNPKPEAPQGGSVDHHGTHTAGLVAAVMNNNRGVVGMAPSCKLMPVRTGLGTSIYFGLEGIIYAANNGADIISLSWGGNTFSSFEQDVVTDAAAQGSLIVAAAGNQGSMFPHYPAAYGGVLSVGATGPDDHRAGFSNYGTWVKVSAPGSSILSLGYNSYVVISGTSMSTPIVAGVAALVKSYHPAWSGAQVYNQILFTADPIDALNPGYAGMMGSGRVNAYRAVAETAPGLSITNLSTIEQTGDMDGRLDPGETAALIISLENSGSVTSDVRVMLSSSNVNLQVVQGNWIIPQLAAETTINNASSPFVVSASLLASSNLPVTLTFSARAESFYRVDLPMTIWIDPNFADHDTGNVLLTVTDFGAFGYLNYLSPYDPPPGSGLRFPKNSANVLYLGSMMAGVSPSKVSDCAWGDFYTPRYDWQTVDGGEILITPGTAADQSGLAIYQDTGAPVNNQCGLRVTQNSYAWTETLNEDFVILSFSLQNVSGNQLDSLYAGIFLDLDVAYHDSNKAGWEPEQNMGYLYNPMVLTPNPRYYGLSILSNPAVSYRVIDIFNDLYPYERMTDSMKYVYMSSGMVQTVGLNLSDYAMLLSAGPYSLVAGDSVLVSFAVLGGDNLNDLRSNADAAQMKWDNLASTPYDFPSFKPTFTITGTTPQPANGSVNLSFFLPGASRIVFDLIDVLGRVIPIWAAYYPEAGSHSVILPDRDLTSGVYILRGTSDFGRSAVKMVWLK
jgi:hypothetical protein